MQTKDKDKKTKNKKSHRVDVRMPNGERITKKFDRKCDADIFRSKLKLEKARTQSSGIYINSNIPFKEFVESWFKAEVKDRKAPRTVECYRSDIKNYILPVAGDTILKAINTNHAREIENRMLAKKKHPRTVNKVITIFKTILNDAVKSDNLIKSPLKGYPELKEPPKELRYWLNDEVQQFLVAVKERPLYLFYVVVLNTGMRLGEIVGLRFDRIDLINRQIDISRGFTRTGPSNHPKTYIKRVIPMNDEVYRILKDLFDNRSSGLDGFVFTRDDGRPLDYNHINERQFRKDQQLAKMKKLIRFHDLRHVYASHFMMNGGDSYTLQQLLGHKNIKMTMIYAHLDRKYLQRASGVVNFSLNSLSGHEGENKREEKVSATILPHKHLCGR